MVNASGYNFIANNKYKFSYGPVYYDLTMKYPTTGNWKQYYVKYHLLSKDEKKKAPHHHLSLKSTHHDIV